MSVFLSYLCFSFSKIGFFLNEASFEKDYRVMHCQQNIKNWGLDYIKSYEEEYVTQYSKMHAIYLYN